MRITTADHINIRVKDLEATVAFYQGVLGLEPDRLDDFRAGRRRYAADQRDGLEGGRYRRLGRRSSGGRPAAQRRASRAATDAAHHIRIRPEIAQVGPVPLRRAKGKTVPADQACNLTPADQCG